MRKQILKAITMLVSIVTLAFMTALVSNAQSSREPLRANIPFDFIVGDKTLEAGKYIVGTVTGSSDEGIRVQSRDGRQSAMRLTNGVQPSNARAIHPEPKRRSRNEKNGAMLTFHRYGNTYFLAQVWRPGATEGRELLKSKAESAVERELAKNPSQSDLAQNTQPETVTIYAELQ
jgi:hypothetical protein